jgi:hypothetical protein
MRQPGGSSSAVPARPSGMIATFSGSLSVALRQLPAALSYQPYPPNPIFKSRRDPVERKLRFLRATAEIGSVSR